MLYIFPTDVIFVVHQFVYILISIQCEFPFPGELL